MPEREPTRIFITGASSGLGEGLARLYAAPGRTLGLVARREQRLAALAKELEARGAAARCYTQDVRSTEGMARAAADFCAVAGGVDLVIANAGGGIRDAIREGEAGEVAELWSTNVLGVSNTLIPFVPRMLEQRSGVLVGMGSIAGYRGLPGRAAYSASKAAVKVFVDGLRMDLHGTGVHAMTLCPGFVRTPMTESNPRMIFAIDVDRAVRSIARAIAQRRRTYAFPWQMNLLRHVMTRVPESWLRRLSPAPRTRSSR